MSSVGSTTAASASDGPRASFCDGDGTGVVGGDVQKSFPMHAWIRVFVLIAHLQQREHVSCQGDEFDAVNRLVERGEVVFRLAGDGAADSAAQHEAVEQLGIDGAGVGR